MFGYHTLRREQRLPGTPDEVFPFFADAGNLEAITPPFLGFRIVTPQVSPGGSPSASPARISMHVGTTIEYELKLHGLPISWLTQIEDWEPGVRFVDRQLRGPYALWHHTHDFVEAGDGTTLMRDTVRYAMPFGPAGRLAHTLFVRRDLERIFDFRRDEVARRMR